VTTQTHKAIPNSWRMAALLLGVSVWFSVGFISKWAGGFPASRAGASYTLIDHGVETAVTGGTWYAMHVVRAMGWGAFGLVGLALAAELWQRRSGLETQSSRAWDAVCLLLFALLILIVIVGATATTLRK
jgi:hypothetical protein